MGTRKPAALLAAAILTASTAAWGGILRVETWGADSAACGGTSDPCATITQAVANAGQNDRILVGPGVYAGGFTLSERGMRLESTAGARATIVSGGAVGITVTGDRVMVGRKQRGFTVEGATGAGVLVSGAERVLVEGVMSLGNGGHGFHVTGVQRTLFSRSLARNNGGNGYLLEGEQHGVRLCGAIENTGHGVEMRSSTSVMLANLAQGNGGSGFVTASGADVVYIRDNISDGNTGDGYALGGLGVRVQRNIATDAGGRGFHLQGLGMLVTDNLAEGGADSAFYEASVGGALRMTGNTATGSGGDGFELMSGDLTSLVFQRNNSYGHAQCGLNSAAAAMTASRNWWGTEAPTTGFPADVCGAVTTKPASRPNAIRTRNDL